jgi:hypothetical protein
MVDKSEACHYESGERRLDLLELEQVCAVLDIALVDFVKRYHRAAN